MHDAPIAIICILPTKTIELVILGLSVTHSQHANIYGIRESKY
jgi:hypothetical protein